MTLLIAAQTEPALNANHAFTCLLDCPICWVWKSFFWLRCVHELLSRNMETTLTCLTNLGHSTWTATNGYNLITDYKLHVIKKLYTVCELIQLSKYLLCPPCFYISDVKVAKSRNTFSQFRSCCSDFSGHSHEFSQSGTNFSSYSDTTWMHFNVPAEQAARKRLWTSRDAQVPKKTSFICLNLQNDLFWCQDLIHLVRLHL